MALLRTQSSDRRTARLREMADHIPDYANEPRGRAAKDG